ncbi:MAG: DUF2087 domain-containing protein [Burkholderiaceae bacterium]|nr:DUF2087 domain-containing protein [Roseateles sp.]MBV8470434.1 DUF2087 domain-containing protein [Burkholderiaceae bacterium]
MSALARSLCKQWRESDDSPGHVQMLHMLARAAGHPNFQAFRVAAQPIRPDLDQVSAVDAHSDAKQQAEVLRLLRHFDESGRLKHWPRKLSTQIPCVWAVWARVPARKEMSEREVNEFIKQGEAIGDHVLLRRELVNHKLMGRTPDCRVYWRIERPVPNEYLMLLKAVMARGKMS